MAQHRSHMGLTAGRLRHLLLSAFVAVVASAEDSTSCASPAPSQLIPADYDRLRAPLVDGRPLAVRLSVWVSAVTSVSELRQEFSVALYLRLKWRDHRVTFPPLCRRRPFVVVDSAALQRLWLPDVYFAGEKRATRHAVTRLNAALRLDRANSTLNLSQRLTVTLLCSYDFQLFPLDFQVCEMAMEPYAYDRQFVELDFDPPGIYFNNFRFRIPQFRLTHVAPGNCSYTYVYQGITLRQSCVRVAFFFERAFSYYLLQMYVPSTLLVVISCLSFWVPVTVVPGRIALSITTLLTLGTQSQALQRVLPPVSYMKASDVWMFACILIVFATLIEFTVSYWHHERRCTASASPPPFTARLHEPAGVRVSGGRLRHCLRRRLRRAASSPHFVDSAAKLLFPLAFAVFNAVYWLYVIEMRERKYRFDKITYIA